MCTLSCRRSLFRRMSPSWSKSCCLQGRLFDKDIACHEEGCRANECTWGFRLCVRASFRRAGLECTYPNAARLFMGAHVGDGIYLLQEFNPSSRLRFLSTHEQGESMSWRQLYPRWIRIKPSAEESNSTSTPARRSASHNFQEPEHRFGQHAPFFSPSPSR